MTNRTLGPVGVVLLALFAAACGGPTSTTGGQAVTTVEEEAASVAEGEVVVAAAASLADAFGEMEVAFEESHRGVDVVLNLAGSSSLREQILEGAPVDVFASADTRNVDTVVGADLAERPEILARNLLQIVVPAGNPGGVTGLESFADDDLLIGLCAEDVPCGRLAREVLAASGVTAALDTNEPDVRALLTKVAAGELDAGIVYVTDVAAADGVEGIEIPDGVNVATDYPIVVLRAAPNPGGAAAFVDFALSAEGRAVLAAHGFELP